MRRRMALASLLDRRTFVRRALGASAGAIAGGAALVREVLGANPWAVNEIAPAERGRAPNTFCLALVLLDSTAQRTAIRGPSWRMGTELGVDEVGRAATLLRKPFVTLPAVHDLAAARALIEAERPSAMVVAAGAADIVELGEQSTRSGVLLINCLAAEDALRNAQCDRATFHVAASESMQSDARRMTGEKTDASSATELWDAGLERFGAAQLNDRFRARFAKPMDSAAWAGWFAVKVAWEASQRARAVDGHAIAEYLERGATSFDGHKGVPLSFRTWDHQLRQPLYVVPSRESVASQTSAASGGRAVLTVPADAGASRASLDSLGTTAEASRCRWR